MAIKTTKLKNATCKILLIAATVAAFAICYLTAKWSFANMASVNTAEPEVADLMTRLAPDDPQTHFAAAVLYDKTFLPDDQTKSLTEYEWAVALSPNNYLLWLEFGKARERCGDADGSEKALLKAQELAPNYAAVQWALGNVWLRHGNAEKGFAEIRKAVAGNQTYAAPAVTAAWQIFEGDVPTIKNLIGDSVQMRAAFAVLLERQSKFDEAVEIWNTIPQDEKRTSFSETGKSIFASLVEAKKFAAAQSVLASMSNRNSGQKIGQITDGGFENEIKIENTSIFEWQIAAGAQPQIALTDGQKHGGNRSLVLLFNSSGPNDFRTISQTVVIEPGKTYRFEAFYKAELKTDASLKWEIADAGTGKALGVTAPIAASSDWSALNAQFKAPENTEAVIVRLVLDGCKSAVCPISGRVLFDDVSLIEINGK